MKKWKDIPEYEGYYQASKSGGIRSLPRNGNIGKKRVKDGLLKQSINKGYIKVNLSKNNIVKNKKVHFLVCKTFNQEPDYGECVEHLDSNSLNNHYKNLRFSTLKENSQTAVKAGRYKKIAEILGNYSRGKCGELNHATRKIVQMDMEGNIIKDHVSATYAAKELGICRQHISHCCTGARKSCGGFKWAHK